MMRLGAERIFENKKGISTGKVKIRCHDAYLGIGISVLHVPFSR
jgi:hypothetical protein